MCDLGLALGLASGVAGVVGKRQAASKNNAMVADELENQQVQRQREYIIDSEAAQKDGNRAAQQRDRTRAQIVAMGGVGGNTMALRSAEQSRQGSLSIQAARDRQKAGLFNYKTGTSFDSQRASNRVAANTPNTLTDFMDVATSGVRGYGAFKR